MGRKKKGKSGSKEDGQSTSGTQSEHRRQESQTQQQSTQPQSPDQAQPSQPREQSQQSHRRGQPQQSQHREQPQQSQHREQPQQSQHREQPQQQQQSHLLAQEQQSPHVKDWVPSQGRGRGRGRGRGQQEDKMKFDKPGVGYSYPSTPISADSKGDGQSTSRTQGEYRRQESQTQPQSPDQAQPSQPRGQFQQWQQLQRQSHSLAQEQQRPHVKDWVPSQGRGRGRGRGQHEDKMKFDKPGEGGMQQGRGKGERSSTESKISSLPVSPSSPPSSLGQSVRESASKEQIKVGEVAAALQQLPLSHPSPRPITAGGDAPPQLLPHISGVKRRGGTECRLRTRVITNYFPLNIGRLKTAIHYDVAITPDKPKNLFREIIENFRKKHFPNRYPAYDGNKNLYSSSPLFESAEIFGSVEVKENERKKDYQVTIKFATYVDLTCLQNYVEHVSRKSVIEMEKPMQALQCLDIVLRNASGLSCIPVGRSYFTRPANPFKLGDGCVLYNGFYQAAILGWKPFVNVDVAHKAFPSALNMIELCYDMFGKIDLREGLQPYQREALNRHIKQLKVQYELPNKLNSRRVEHEMLPNSRRVCRVNELGPTATEATFTENGRTMTVEQYFREVKKTILKFPNLPTLWVGSRTRENKILLPFEYCVILADQVVNKKMTELQTRNMIREAATNTTKRLQNIQHSVASANYNGSLTMREFGISVNPKPQEVEARILHPPSLLYNAKVESVQKGVWRAAKFCKGATLSFWSIICLDYRTRDDSIHRLENELVNNARILGMNMSPPAPFTRVDDRNLKENLRRYFTSKKYEMVIVVLNNRKDCYNYVKQASEITVGCLTQCLKSATVYNLKPTTVSNILLKINAKLNGENHRINDLPVFLRKPCMIMGADVTHPGPDSQDFPSVAAVTASFDVSYFKYIFEWRLQQSRQEMIEDLQEITRQHLLNFFRKNNGTRPEKIIYVRDGVSDGQFVEVLNVELRAIRAACQKMEHNYNPPIIFVVVQKRHHTRFFPTDSRISEDKNFNVPAGTCVDTEITHPSLIDFYLVSHASIQGVAKPTKYVKLWDDSDMTEDDIEKLMYYLCHMFARCNRSVSYPAPTYYAHLAAARARVYCEIDRIDMRNLPREQQRLTIKENISKGMPMFFV